MFYLGQRYCPPAGGNTLLLATLLPPAGGQYTPPLRLCARFAARIRLRRTAISPRGLNTPCLLATLERTKSRFDGVPMIGQ